MIVKLTEMKTEVLDSKCYYCAKICVVVFNWLTQQHNKLSYGKLFFEGFTIILTFGSK